MAEVYKPGEKMSFTCTDALDDSGYVLKLTGETTVAKCTSSDIPFGIAYMDTKNPITETAESNKAVAVITEGVAEVKVSTGAGETIDVGDVIGIGSTDGVAGIWSVDTTDLSSYITSKKKIIGIALEAVAASTSTKIKVWLTLGANKT